MAGSGDSVTFSKNEVGINEASVSAVYRKVLAGENLESIEMSDGIKEIIRAFSKYSNLSARQISEKTGISAAICTKLRKISRAKRRRRDRYVECDRYGIPYAVTQLLKGKDAEYLKLHFVTPETIKKAKKCLKIMESGGKAPDLYKMGVSHSQSLKLIELYRERHTVVSVPMLPTY